MTWEEYENSDWYREAHPERFERRSTEDKIEEEMRRYIGCLDEYRERINEQIKMQEEKNDGDVDPCLYKEILLEDKDTDERIVRYVTTKIFNGRVRGILRVGNYKQCLLARYNYNIACINSEWDWAGIERIVASNEEELDEILIGYRECEYDDYYDDYDY